VDVLVHPNPREPFGIVPLEAMAADLPVLVPAAGGVLAYANRNNAWLAEASGSSFAAAVLDLVGQPAEQKRRVENARKTAAALSWLHVTASYFQLYDRLHHRFERERFKSSQVLPGEGSNKGWVLERRRSRVVPYEATLSEKQFVNVDSDVTQQ
jgi:Glycosyl transferases group 1